MIKVITSKDNPRVKFALSLKENKYRKIHHMFLAETFNALEMALEANQLVETFSTEWLNLPESVNQNIVSEEILKKLSSNVHPEGVVFIAKMNEEVPENPRKILYLDHISDPGNMGTLIRTALAFSYDLVVASNDSVSFYNEKVINSSKGAIFKMPIITGDLSKYEDHVILASTLSDDSIDVKEVKVPEKFILVLGNESHGVSKDIIKKSNLKVKISINNIDSLNVAVAGGILMNYIH